MQWFAVCAAVAALCCGLALLYSAGKDCQVIEARLNGSPKAARDADTVEVLMLLKMVLGGACLVSALGIGFAFWGAG